MNHESPIFFTAARIPAIIVAGATITYHQGEQAFRIRYPGVLGWVETITGYEPTSSQLRDAFFDALEFLLAMPEEFSVRAQDWISANRAEIFFMMYAL